MRDEYPVEIGGREIVAFECVQKDGELETIYPIPIDGSQSLTFRSTVVTRTIDVYPIGNEIGKRIAEAYDDGRLPVDCVSWDIVFGNHESD